MEKVVDALSNVNREGECHGQNQSAPLLRADPAQKIPENGRSAPDSLKALKTLTKRNRKKLDKKQNPNPGLTTRYCVLCYNPRVISISSSAAPAANSRALKTGKSLIGDINSFREVRSSRGGHLALVLIPKFSFSSSGAITA